MTSEQVIENKSPCVENIASMSEESENAAPSFVFIHLV